MARVTRIGVLVLAGLVAFGPMSLPVRAEQAGAGQVAALTQDLRALTEAMQIHDVLAIMQAEGQDYGKQLRDEMFPGKGGAEWQATVTRIYDPARMHEEFTARLAKELAVKPGVASAAADFFASETGRKIIGLELEARRALLDPVIEETARKAFEKMEAENSPRLEALRRFAKVNDLIEMNVMGALNANFAFYQGMASGGALGAKCPKRTCFPRSGRKRSRSATMPRTGSGPISRWPISRCRMRSCRPTRAFRNPRRARSERGAVCGFRHQLCPHQPRAGPRHGPDGAGAGYLIRPGRRAGSSVLTDRARFLISSHPGSGPESVRVFLFTTSPVGRAVRGGETRQHRKGPQDAETLEGKTHVRGPQNGRQAVQSAGW
ncbi:hypothetical protein ACFSHQ_19085 [Gemmobacter lanyuensis]